MCCILRSHPGGELEEMVVPLTLEHRLNIGRVLPNAPSFQFVVPSSHTHSLISIVRTVHTVHLCVCHTDDDATAVLRESWLHGDRSPAHRHGCRPTLLRQERKHAHLVLLSLSLMILYLDGNVVETERDIRFNLRNFIETCSVLFSRMLNPICPPTIFTGANGAVLRGDEWQRDHREGLPAPLPLQRAGQPVGKLHAYIPAYDCICYTYMNAYDGLFYAYLIVCL